MADNNEKLEQLQQRLNKVIEYQGFFDKEINSIRNEINLLLAEQRKQNFSQSPPISEKPPIREYVPPPRTPQNEPKVEQTQQTQSQYQKPPISTTPPSYQNTQTTPPFSQSNYSSGYTQADKNNLEKFIGENLLSKIGIVILIIGVAIGAKYAIDNNWISPLMRIIFGYFVGFALIGFAVKTKEKYLNFSAVLISGGMATMYFITYFAYSYYNLISQISAFSVMLIFTIFTVLAAINYNRQIIAQIGLVGAYAIPFLLSENTGQVQTLFTYIAIINIGILAVSAYKYWRSLFYSSFIFTWITFAAWYSAKYQPNQDFALAFTFLSIFFVIFYATFLIYKLLNHEDMEVENVFIILSNSFIFYGFGYSILARSDDWKNSLGFFTILNAFVHFSIGWLIRQFRLGNKTVFYLTVILVLTFLSIAFPIHTKGEWTALFWTAEAAALFWIGRTKAIALFENYSYPVMFLACVAMFGEWVKMSEQEAISPIFNQYFVVGIFFVLGFGFINFINGDEKYESSLHEDLKLVTKFVLPAVFLFAFYNVVRVEIGNYFNLQAIKTAVQTTNNGYPFPVFNPAVTSYNILWQFNYTMFFLTVLGWVNIKKIKSDLLGYANLGLNAIVTALFLVVGLYVLSDLRDLYLTEGGKIEYFQHGIFHLAIRHISIPFLLLLFWTSYKYIKQEFITKHLPSDFLLKLFDLGFYFSIWVLASSELLHWLDIFSVKDSYKLGLSILWGIYALLLIILGIYYRKAHLRIGAIVLFSLTLAKLFLYDLSDLSTIAKTVVFVSLGVLLLIISFLYNKYKGMIFED